MRVYFAVPGLDETLAALEYFRDKRYADPAWLSLNAEVFKARYAAAARLKEAGDGASAGHGAGQGEAGHGDGAFGARLGQGVCLCDPAALPIDLRMSCDLFGELCSILAGFGTLSRADAAALSAAAKAGSLDTGEMVRAVVRGDGGSVGEMVRAVVRGDGGYVGEMVRAEVRGDGGYVGEMVRAEVRGEVRGDGGYVDGAAAPLHADAATLAWVAENVARVALVGFCRALAPVVEVEGNGVHRCPCCGSEPNLAMLEGEEGRRILKCSLCHTRWEFPRGECPFCRDIKPSAMKFLCYDVEDAHRVYACDSCMRYIRTTDLRKCRNRVVVPEVEALATGYLNDMARKQGYGLPT